MAKSDAQLKVRKKKWFSVLAPGIFREVVVGEVPLYEADQLNGRRLSVNMMALTNNPKNQGVSVKLKIVNVKDGKGSTELTGMECTPGSIKRLMRRGRTKVEDSFIVKTSDGKLVRVKPVLVTNSLATNGVTAAIRRVVRNNTANICQKLTFERLADDVISYKLQKHLQGVVSKVAPIRNCEIKALLLVERQGAKPIIPGEDKDLPVKQEGDFFEDETLQADAAQSLEEPRIEA